VECCVNFGLFAGGLLRPNKPRGYHVAESERFRWMLARPQRPDSFAQYVTTPIYCRRFRPFVSTGEKSMSSAFGRSVSIHRGMFSAGLTLWYVGGVFVAGGAIGMFQSLTGKAAADSLGVGAVGLVVGMCVLFVAHLRWKQTLEIFEGGFVWKRLIGTNSATREQIRKVEHVTHRSRRGTYIEVAVELTTGTHLSIVGIENPDQAVSMLSSVTASQPVAASSGWQPPGTAHSAQTTGWVPPGPGGVR